MFFYIAARGALGPKILTEETSLRSGAPAPQSTRPLSVPSPPRPPARMRPPPAAPRLRWGELMGGVQRRGRRVSSVYEECHRG